MPSDKKPDDALMTYQEAAQYLAVPVGTLYAWVSQDRVPHVRMAARTVRFRREELTRWLEDRSVPGRG